ncbi:MAG: CheR family methyltransferase, partial [Myxococcales bacterium]
MATGLELDASGRIEISDSDFAKLSHLIQTRLGIKMPPAKKPVIQSRLLRRLRILGIATFHDYCQYLFDSDNSQEELSQFLDLATTNKTNFFREPQHFEILTRQVLPSLAERSRRVSVWSAGCSTGEEPYTLAMVLSEFVESRGLTFSVLATDVSGRVLEQ